MSHPTYLPTAQEFGRVPVAPRDETRWASDECIAMAHADILAAALALLCQCVRVEVWLASAERGVRQRG
jgi:hypothetical protein